MVYTDITADVHLQREMCCDALVTAKQLKRTIMC